MIWENAFITPRAGRATLLGILCSCAHGKPNKFRQAQKPLEILFIKQCLGVIILPPQWDAFGFGVILGSLRYGTGQHIRETVDILCQQVSRPNMIVGWLLKIYELKKI